LVLLVDAHERRGRESGIGLVSIVPTGTLSLRDTRLVEAPLVQLTGADFDDL
jgi:hypothetical protein